MFAPRALRAGRLDAGRRSVYFPSDAKHGRSAVLILLIGFIAARVVSRLVLRMILERLDAQQ